MARYDIVLFDADETLFDYVRAAQNALRSTLSQYSIPFPENVWERYQHWNNLVWRQFEQGKIEKPRLQIQRFECLFEELTVKADAAQFNQDYMLALSAGDYALPGAQELCEALFPYCQLYIVTNGFTFTQERRMERSPLKPYIRKMYISEQVGFQKPRREYFDAVLSDIGVADKSRVILLGDSLTSDMAGGRNAQIPTCWYNPFHKDSGGMTMDYEIYSLDAFVPIVL